MKVQFLGAAKTVTGSCYMIEACGKRFCVDCGMHQGNKAIEQRNRDIKPYLPGNIDFILITHAHIDHTGLLPLLVRNGFRGRIYATDPTVELCGIMLRDSAHIQEFEAEWKNRKGKRSGAEPVEPMYTIQDAEAAVRLFRGVEYGKKTELAPGLEIEFVDVGHLLGSSSIEIWVTENGTTTKLVFSGDIGNQNQPLIKDPTYLADADYVVMESTYGDRLHGPRPDYVGELTKILQRTFDRGGNVVIPSFAVGRTQEILYCLYLLRQQGKLPEDMPIFVDSPLAIRATEVFKTFKDYLDTPEVKLTNNMATLLPNVKFTLDAAESQALNDMKGPAIIISASGMCNAGRIQHHLRHNAWRPTASIVFVGYQGVGTPGRRIVDGASSIRLFNEDIAIKAKVFTIGGFSAHAGQSQILDWIRKMPHSSMQVVLVHGEEKAQQTLSGLIKEEFNLPVSIPGYMEEMELVPGAMPEVVVTAKAQSYAHVDWELLLEETESKMAKLRARLENAQSRPWDEQVDIRDRVLDLNKELLSVLTQL